MAFTSYETGFGHNPQAHGIIGKFFIFYDTWLIYYIGATGNSRNVGLGGNSNLVKSHQQIGQQ